MDIRYSCNQKDFKRYTTEEMRDEMLITGLYKADEVVAVYSHVDRMVTLGCMPVHETVSIDKGIDIWANFGTHYFLERREIGMFNIGKDSTGIVVADGVKWRCRHHRGQHFGPGGKVPHQRPEPVDLSQPPVCSGQVLHHPEGYGSGAAGVLRLRRGCHYHR